MLEQLLSRRSVPPQLLAEPGPTADELDAILTAAARVPDHGKLVPWRFLVLQGPSRARAGEIVARTFRARNPEASEEKVALEAGRFTRAPLVVGIVSRAAAHAKIPEWEQVLSAGAVCMNLIHAANALGFATAWLTEWYAYDPDVTRALGLGEGERIAGFIHVGRNDVPQSDRVRPVLADLVSHPV